jgi:GNAT superfamily N-acetyltransferase
MLKTLNLPTLVPIAGGYMLKIRPFIPEDQKAARTLILQGLGERFGFIDTALYLDLDDIAEHYQTHVFCVAEFNGEFAGTGALVFNEDGSGQIVRMSVARPYRRLGIGRAILQHLIDIGQAYQLNAIHVETHAAWDDVIDLYTCSGFEEYARSPEQVQLRMPLN